MKRRLKNFLNLVRTQIHPKDCKVFGIGRNKTGTTSLKMAMMQLGYVVRNQRTAELFLDDWAERDFRRLINYCKTAQFFQDVPFSLPCTYKALDEHFKGSKFILPVRNSPEEWYESLVRVHSKLWGKNGRVPTKEDLQNAYGKLCEFLNVPVVNTGFTWENKS